MNWNRISEQIEYVFILMGGFAQNQVHHLVLYVDFDLNTII